MFRKHVLDLKGKRLEGDIILTQPISIYITATAIFIIMLLIIMFLSISNYARKETVRGYLVPDMGLIKLYPNQSGTLDTLFVKDGVKVKKGDVLANIVLSRSQINGVDLSENIISILEQKRELLDRDIIETEAIMSSELEALKQKKLDLKLLLESLNRKIKLLKHKELIHVAEFQRYKKLNDSDFVSKVELQKREQETILSKEALENAVNSKLSMQAQINDIIYKIQKAPHELELKLTLIKRTKSDVERQLNEAKNNYTFSIIAKESGVVTAISAKEGERLSVNRPLLSIIPQNAELVAELFFPTRSAGFVAKGDEARLRFEAFPYQRFGFIEGLVTRVDKSLVVNDEIDAPIQLQEPVYRVQVKLATQSIKAYGDFFPLKAGMLLEADIILEKRSLLQWLLDPIYSLRGRVG
ncbi:HlyD family secretion protein [Vibrio alginolyticus]|uniref:HlyD family secretion protein n=1 Tax=Vibrio alginolyticus TaxID=663 RepID=UPI00130347A8|nr:HlyD family efflux transporter periplasmic adaptor subunit [Vibrio alginolyticus]ELP9499397.1 HlyD family efflux transporter periplasmic adaptor subunit [Vibrio alginolyticus]